MKLPDQNMPGFNLPNLPLVNALVDRLQSEGFSFEKSAHLICVQHLLATNITLFKSLFELGIDPARTIVLGKGYSDSQRCIDALRELGATVFAAQDPATPGRYGTRRDEEIKVFWEFVRSRISSDDESPVFVGDVGGRLMLHVSDTLHAGWTRPHVVAVEQTSSGLRRVERNTFRLPLVNLARAAAKCARESRILANGILERIDRESPGNWPNVRACVIGRGSVGNALASALSARDILFEAFGEDDAGEDEALLQEGVKRADVIFGCTGEALFDNWPNSAFRDGQVLVSCSSEDIEFSPLLRLIPEYASSGWPVPHTVIPVGSGTIRILRGGFPINFDDSGVSLPEQEIQITTALTLAAFVAAARHAKGAGADATLIEISDELQHWIIGQTQGLIGQ
jgi:hypothetical protein